jgi:hypothetical protein
MKAKPIDINETEILAAKEGRSAEIIGKRKPLDLSEDEVKRAREGKFEEVMKKKAKKSTG